MTKEMPKVVVLEGEYAKLLAKGDVHFWGGWDNATSGCWVNSKTSETYPAWGRDDGEAFKLQCELDIRPYCGYMFCEATFNHTGNKEHTYTAAMCKDFDNDRLMTTRAVILKAAIKMEELSQ